jgi:hypothetical protein
MAAINKVKSLLQIMSARPQKPFLRRFSETRFGHAKNTEFEESFLVSPSNHRFLYRR